MLCLEVGLACLRQKCLSRVWPGDASTVARSILLACKQLEPLISLSRTELFRLFVPAPCLGEIGHHSVDTHLLENRRVVGFGQRHSRACIARFSRAPQHEAGRRQVATRNQSGSSTERRGDLARIEVMNGSRWDHALRDSGGLRSTTLQRALIGTHDVLVRWCRSGHRDTSNDRRNSLRRRRPLSLVWLSDTLCWLRRIGPRRCGRNRQNGGHGRFEIHEIASCGFRGKQREQNCRGGCRYDGQK